nr:hypothetical protein [uncultured Treponema sp.]
MAKKKVLKRHERRRWRIGSRRLPAVREAGLKGANTRFATGRQNLQRAHKSFLILSEGFFILNRDGKTCSGPHRFSCGSAKIKYFQA